MTNTSLLFTLGSIVKLSRKYIDQHVKEFNLNRNEWLVLAFLKHNPLPVTQTAIKTYVGIDNSNLTKLLDKLEASEWIIKENSEQDRRNKLIRLNKKHHHRIKKLFKIFDQLDQIISNLLSKTENNQLLQNLDAIKQTLQSI